MTSPLVRLWIKKNKSSLGCMFLDIDGAIKKPNPEFIYTSSSGFQIRCWQYPELKKGCLYLPGEFQERDSDVFLGTT